MSYPFFQLLFAHLKMLYLNRTALFWNFAMPSGLYMALTILPLPKMLNIPYKDFVLPGMISYVIMSNGIYGLAYWMAEMRSKNVIKRFIASPIKIRDLVLSLVASRIIIMLFQTLFLSLLGIICFDFQFNGNLLAILLFIILGGGIFLLIGLLIANFSSSYETVTPLTTIVGMPMIFFGNVFFATQSLPHWLYQISRILPLSHLAVGLRQSYLSHTQVTELTTPLGMLLLWLMGLLLLTNQIFKLKE